MNLPSTEIREIRRFGLIALVFFGCLCGLGIWTGKPFPMYLFGSLGVLGILFMLLPSRLKPLYVGWLKVARGIGRITTIVMLSLVYFLVITPSALVKRLLSGRPLPVKPNRNAASYWVERTEPAQPRERFLKRY